MLGGARARYRTTHCSLYCADLADLFYLHAGTRVMAHVEQEEEKSGGKLIQFALFRLVRSVHGGCRTAYMRRRTRASSRPTGRELATSELQLDRAVSVRDRYRLRASVPATAAQMRTTSTTP